MSLRKIMIDYIYLYLTITELEFQLHFKHEIQIQCIDCKNFPGKIPKTKSTHII